MMPVSDATVSIERCPLCNEALVPGANECPRCDWVRGYEERKNAGNIEMRDLAAACLSIIPGAGHLYKGHTIAGWIFMGGTLLAIFLCSLVATFTMGLGLLLLPLYWLWVIFQAYWIEDLKIPGHTDRVA
jgi:hypothetical protein